MKTYVPDTSAIIDGTLSKMISEKKIKQCKILIHNAVISELEAQANRGKEIGLIGLKEVQNLIKIKSKNISIEFVGERPKEFPLHEGYWYATISKNALSYMSR